MEGLKNKIETFGRELDNATEFNLLEAPSIASLITELKVNRATLNFFQTKLKELNQYKDG